MILQHRSPAVTGIWPIELVRQQTFGSKHTSSFATASNWEMNSVKFKIIQGPFMNQVGKHCWKTWDLSSPANSQQSILVGHRVWIRLELDRGVIEKWDARNIGKYCGQNPLVIYAVEVFFFMFCWLGYDAAICTAQQVIILIMLFTSNWLAIQQLQAYGSTQPR